MKKNMTKTLGIGYTLYEFDGKTKRPLNMTKAHPGNLAKEIAKIERKIAKMSNSKTFNLALWMGAFGYVFRAFLEVIR